MEKLNRGEVHSDSGLLVINENSRQAMNSSKSVSTSDLSRKFYHDPLPFFFTNSSYLFQFPKYTLCVLLLIDARTRDSTKSATFALIPPFRPPFRGTGPEKLTQAWVHREVPASANRVTARSGSPPPLLPAASMVAAAVAAAAITPPESSRQTFRCADRARI